MDIYNMHVLFRTLGQQQGLQQVRAILAESIDQFLNEAIMQIARINLLSNAQAPKDSRTPQYTKISPLNAFHTLYCTEIIDITVDSEGDEIEISLTNVPLCITNFVIQYNNGKKFDCRVIESERLYQTLNDYLNRASYEYPIVSLVNGNSDKEFNINLFTGGKHEDVQSIITSYIKMPAVVYFDEVNYGQESDSSVNCDLPEHLHNTVVEAAVELWFQTLGLTSKQQSEQSNKQNS